MKPVILITRSVALLLVCMLSASQILAQESYLDSLKNWIKNNPKVDSLYIVTLHRISYRTSESDIKTSFEYYEKVTRLSNEMDFTYGKSLAQINLGILLSNSANYDASNEAYFKAIAYAREANAPRLISISLNNIGENFRSLKDWQRCREYTLQAIEINRQIQAWRGVAINYELLQQCDLSENRIHDAKRHLDSGFRFAVLSKDSYIMSLYFLGYGKAEALEGDMEKSKYYFARAMEQASVENDMRNKFYVYQARAKYLSDISTDQKIQNLDSAYSIATHTGFLEGVGQAAEALSDLYSHNGNKDSSMRYFQVYREAYDSIFSENNKRNVVIKEFDWMIKQKAIENHHLQEIATIQKKDIRIKNVLLAALGVLLILSCIIAFFVYKNIKVAKNRQRSEFESRMLKVKMASLQAQMNPHFIFNSLNSIENFVMQNDKLAASEYLNKFASLVRSILDSSSADAIPFAADLKATQTYIELERLRFNNKFDVFTEIDPELLNLEYTVPPLIVQPYIENSIIHGLAPSEKPGLYLKIKAFIQDECIYYIVEDNGIGRDQARKYRAANPSYHKSVGMKLTEEKIDIYSKQNNIATDIQILDLYENDTPTGTRITLTIRIR